MKWTALVIGATGATGSSLIEQLIEDNDYKCIHILHYRKTPFAGRHKVMEHIVDLEEILHFRQEGIDHVFCCIGTTIKKAGSKERFKHVDKDLVVLLAKWAKIDDVLSFHVISAQGADVNSRFFYNKVKGEMEDELTKMNLSSLYIYHPPLLKAKRKEFRLGESIGLGLFFLLSPFMIGPLKNFRPLNVKQLAAKMIFYASIHKAGHHIVSAKELFAKKSPVKNRT